MPPAEHFYPFDTTMKSLVLKSAMIALLAASPALAQNVDQIASRVGGGESSVAVAPAPADTAEAAGDASAATVTTPAIRMQNYRPQDQRGLHIFEAPKDNTPYSGFVLDFTGAFTQQFQALEHSNTASPRPLTDAAGKPYDANELLDIGMGFNLATANLGLNAQLAPGIRIALESYMSSRHHNEFWVKGGYLQVDQSPIDYPLLNDLMEYLTIRVGMFELNYGDAHFRRSDNGNAIYNPFVENYILDSFNTEIGGDVLFRTGPWLAMVGVTDGVNRGGVNLPDERGPAFLGKVGFDSQLSTDLRVRLTGSLYNVNKTPSNNLFGGDRAGSRYYSVMENTQSSLTSQFTSGRLNPGFRNELTTFQINPFVKFGGVEFFGVIERAEGKAATEESRRTWNQYAGEVVYRFLPGDQLYVGGRYNTAKGELNGIADEVSLDRAALSAGWFITPNILVKGEYVTQEYNDFPTTDIRNGGEFDGFVMEGVISF
jgi:hypothetical protein